MPNTIPDALCRAIVQQKLIPVVGAGVSMSLKNTKGVRLFPGWAELLERAAKRIADEGDAKLAAAVTAMLGIGDYQQAADFARKGLGGRLWGQFFKEIFSVTRADIDDASLALPQAVWTLGQRVLTLNYDRVLRFASPCPDDVLELDNTNKNELADFNRNALQHPAVWHLHGRIDNLEKIIFTSESYSKLYLEQDSEYKAALEIFRAVCRDMHLLFVGCSLADAELLAQLARQHQLFAGHAGPHYALVRADDAKEIEAKLAGLPVKLITFSGFGQPLLDKIAAIANTGAAAPGMPAPISTPIPAVPAPVSVTPALRGTRIAVLRANPLGHGEEDVDYIDLLAEFKKLKCHVSLHPLNIATLNALADVDYIFILSRLIKNRIVIEDEFLDSRNIGLPELEQNLGCDQVRGVCLFLSNFSDSSSLPADALAELTLPTLILPRQDKQQAASFCFQLFKKPERKWLTQQTGANLDAFHLPELKDKPVWKRTYTDLPTLIDAKSTRDYIGRTSDLHTLCREVLQLASSNEVLVIKGSGGIGKTATIKKIAVAMAARGLFAGGIDFIDCEFITDYSTFANKAVVSFNLENALDLPRQLRERFGKEDKLIILDNLETLLYLPEAERGPMLAFIDLLADHASVVVTTREVPPLTAMREITLRPFTSEEGYALFMQTLGQRKLADADADFIRVEIVEKLLDNNPLAIKLVARNLPSGKGLHDLRQELDQDIFGKANDAEYADYTAFDQLASGNIERKKSLFASINFSYRHLGPDAQRTFELLALFPDGIGLHNLQQVGEQRRAEARKGKKEGSPLVEWRINDAVIKQLEDKSITQVDNGVIKLQSIVGKFAEYQLSRRNPAEQAQQHHNALAFHIGLAQLLGDLKDDKPNVAAQLFNSNRGNFLKSLASFELAGIEAESLLEYLNTLSFLASDTGANAVLAQAMARQAFYFAGPANTCDCFALLLLFNQYYGGEFASAFARLQTLLPLAAVGKLVPNTRQANIMLCRAIDIYSMEGETLLDAQLTSKLLSTFGWPYPAALLQLGIITPALLAQCLPSFFTLEAHYQNGSLSAEKVAAYLSQVYEKAHLELMETHYLQAKLAWQQAPDRNQAHTDVQAAITPAQIKKLVSINPFTLGLQHIMLALAEPDVNLQAQQFERGIENLRHIKYYYVEALLLYATCLKQHGQIARYEQIHTEGLALARSHHYRRHQYQFDVLAGKTGAWHEEDYPLPEGLELDSYINWLIKDMQKR